MKGLPGLIRVNQWKVDEQRRKVTELETFADKLAMQIIQLESDMKREGEGSGESVDASQAYSAFLKGAMAQRDTLRDSIEDLHQQIASAKDELAAAYRELKSYEIAQANRERHQARKKELLDRVKMDEIGMTMFRRGGR
ncbi:MAG: flagellar export protein FliJ [Alphaproteobacteria bacterium]